MSIECSHVCSVDYHPQKQHMLVRVEICDPHYNMSILTGFIMCFVIMCSLTFSEIHQCFYMDCQHFFSHIQLQIQINTSQITIFVFVFQVLKYFDLHYMFFSHVYYSMSLQQQLPSDIVIFCHLLFMLAKLNCYVLYRLLQNMSLGYIFGI